MKYKLFLEILDLAFLQDQMETKSGGILGMESAHSVILPG